MVQVLSSCAVWILRYNCFLSSCGPTYGKLSLIHESSTVILVTHGTFIELLGTLSILLKPGKQLQKLNDLVESIATDSPFCEDVT